MTVHEQALRKILKARQISHAKHIAKEALQNPNPRGDVVGKVPPGPQDVLGRPGQACGWGVSLRQENNPC